MKTPVKIQLKFEDFDQYAKLVEQADLVHTQLDAGFFKGELTQVMHGPVIISTHKMNRILLQEGIALKGHTTFLIPGNMEQDISWRKKRLKGNVIGILRSNMEHSGITKSNFYGTPVSIENNFLAEISNLLGYPNFINFIRDKETITLDINNAERIHQLIDICCNNIISDTSIITLEIPKLIIQAISESSPANNFKKGSRRGIVFSKAQEIIHHNFENPIDILSLCKEIGVSERNLRYVFQELSGLSPKKYVRNYKLNKIRKLLQTGRVEKIIDAANQMGFWHTGQFAADYKNLFGELPSETKKQKVWTE